MIYFDYTITAIRRMWEEKAQIIEQTRYRLDTNGEDVWVEGLNTQSEAGTYRAAKRVDCDGATSHRFSKLRRTVRGCAETSMLWP